MSVKTGTRTPFDHWRIYDQPVTDHESLWMDGHWTCGACGEFLWRWRDEMRIQLKHAEEQLEQSRNNDNSTNLSAKAQPERWTAEKLVQEPYNEREAFTEKFVEDRKKIDRLSGKPECSCSPDGMHDWASGVCTECGRVRGINATGCRDCGSTGLDPRGMGEAPCKTCQGELMGVSYETRINAEKDRADAAWRQLEAARRSANELQALVEKYRGALRFYANPDHHHHGQQGNEMVKDCGQRARSVLDGESE